MIHSSRFQHHQYVKGLFSPLGSFNPTSMTQRIDLFRNSGSVDFSVLLSRFSTLKLGGNIDSSILPPNFKSKSGQNNPKTRRTLKFERGLIHRLVMSAGGLLGGAQGTISMSDKLVREEEFKERSNFRKGLFLQQGAFVGSVAGTMYGFAFPYLLAAGFAVGIAEGLFNLKKLKS